MPLRGKTATGCVSGPPNTMVSPGGVYHSGMTLPEAHRRSAEAPHHFPAATPISARQMWATNRFWMETQHLVSKRHGRRRQHWDALMVMLKVLEWGLARVGQLERGRRNAAAIVLRDLELRFTDLPGAFDGFTVLHVSDRACPKICVSGSLGVGS